MRQKTLRIFEVDNYENLKNIVSSKYKLIKNHYFLLKEENKEIEELLKKYNLNYFIKNSYAYIKEPEIVEIEKKVEVIKEIEKIIKVEVEKEVIKQPDIEIYDKIIRSGTEIKSNNNLIFLNRINKGAHIYSEANIIIYNECEGNVICNGEFMIVKSNEGTIIFKDEEVGKIDKLTLITKDGKKVLE